MVVDAAYARAVVALRARLQAHARTYENTGCGELFEAKVLGLALLLLEEHLALAEATAEYPALVARVFRDVEPASRAVARAVEDLGVLVRS